MSRMEDFCDVCCDVCQDWNPGVLTTLAGERKRLRAMGWTTRMHDGKREDVCPACARELGLPTKKAKKPPEIPL